MVGRSPAMQAVFDVLGKASTSDATILLEGETGTGKEVSAEAIHRGSPRRDKPFLVVDCGAMPPQLLESELFGHERGAFTGAVSSRQGVFEAANGGTVFLDEIGELAIDLQPKLLRVLERREVRRVGTNNHVPVNVRLIAATNRNLREQVGGAQVPLRPLLPAGGRRGEAAAAARAAARPARCWSSTSCATSAPSTRRPRRPCARPAFLGALAEHSWPGNIRELRNYLERCVALHDFAPPRSAGDRPRRSRAPRARSTSASRCARRARPGSARSRRRYLEELLRQHENRVSAAARAAGVDRIYFYRLLWKHGLRRAKPSLRETDEATSSGVPSPCPLPCRASGDLGGGGDEHFFLSPPGLIIRHILRPSPVRRARLLQHPRNQVGCGRGAAAGCSSTRNGPPASRQPTRAIQVPRQAVAGATSVATGARCHPEKCGPELRGSMHAGARRCFRKLSST